MSIDSIIMGDTHGCMVLCDVNLESTVYLVWSLACIGWCVDADLMVIRILFTDLEFGSLYRDTTSSG